MILSFFPVFCYCIAVKLKKEGRGARGPRPKSSSPPRGPPKGPPSPSATTACPVRGVPGSPLSTLWDTRPRGRGVAVPLLKHRGCTRPPPTPCQHPCEKSRKKLSSSHPSCKRCQKRELLLFSSGPLRSSETGGVLGRVGRRFLCS